MSGTTMRASVLLTLEDQLSGGLARLTETLDRLDAAAKRLTGTFDHLHIAQPFERATAPIEQTGRAIEGVAKDVGHLNQALGSTVAEIAKVDEAGKGMGGFQSRLNGLRDTARAIGEHLQGPAAALREFTNQVGVLGGAAASAAIIMPAEKYADYENILRHIAITEGKSGGAVAPEVDRLARLFAADAQRTGQPSESIARAFSELVQIGIPATILDRVIGAHSMAATAYNISPEQLGPAVGALLQTMHVPEAQIGPALAAMALASKEGRFKVEDFSMEFPGVAGALGARGMTGRHSADYAFAALETVMKNTSQPAQAAAYFQQALHYIFSPFAERFFKKQGIDLDASIVNAGKHGINPLDAALDVLTGMTKGLGSEQAAFRLGTVLHSQEAGQAIFALLQHRGEFEALTKKLDSTGIQTLDRDFKTAFDGPITTVRLFNENLAQATRTLGDEFMPEMRLISGGFGTLAGLLKGADDHFPILTHAAFAAAGALTLLAAAAGAKSLVGDYAVAGSKLLLSLVGGPEGAALVGGGLLTAEFVNSLRKIAEATAEQARKSNLPPPPMRIQIEAAPGLVVRTPGTDGVATRLPGPLGWTDPSNRVLGRD